jgi:PIN domain nuclease of toxin-antitoxin system
MKRYVIDPGALIAFLEDSRGAQKVEELLNGAAESKQRLSMSMVGWGEVFTYVLKTQGPERGRERMLSISQLPLELVDLDLATTQMAAILSFNNRLAYTASISIALAQQNKAILVTTDMDLEKLGNGFKILQITDLKK